MNDGYTTPCGSVMGVQDSDPRSSKELRKWDEYYERLWQLKMRMREGGGRRMKRQDLIDKLALVREKVMKTMDMISVQGLLPEADAILTDVINDLIKGQVEE